MSRSGFYGSTVLLSETQAGRVDPSNDRRHGGRLHSCRRATEERSGQHGLDATSSTRSTVTLLLGKPRVSPAQDLPEHGSALALALVHDDTWSSTHFWPRARPLLSAACSLKNSKSMASSSPDSRATTCANGDNAQVAQAVECTGTPLDVYGIQSQFQFIHSCNHHYQFTHGHH